MEKKKVILKIESFSVKDGLLLLSSPSHSVASMLHGLVTLCNDRYSGFVRCDMSPPYKPRTTGAGSQNSHIWGHIQQIAEYTGYEIDDVEDMMKRKAVSMGYPYRLNSITGDIIPYSMKDINTQEAGYLIDVLHQWAAELEINLDEGE